jgi:hypothetical protein
MMRIPITGPNEIELPSGLVAGQSYREICRVCRVRDGITHLSLNEAEGGWLGIMDCLATKNCAVQNTLGSIKLIGNARWLRQRV